MCKRKGAGDNAVEVIEIHSSFEDEDVKFLSRCARKDAADPIIIDDDDADDLPFMIVTRGAPMVGTGGSGLSIKCERIDADSKKVRDILPHHRHRLFRRLL